MLNVSVVQILRHPGLGADGHRLVGLTVAGVGHRPLDYARGDTAIYQIPIHFLIVIFKAGGTGGECQENKCEGEHSKILRLRTSCCAQNDTRGFARNGEKRVGSFI
ncbi:hypothetical protein MMG03_000403 [Fibrobacter succinogenes]|nr:hypothetical protein [Fibrobacter succinogenes]